MVVHDGRGLETTLYTAQQKKFAAVYTCVCVCVCACVCWPVGGTEGCVYIVCIHVCVGVCMCVLAGGWEGGLCVYIVCIHVCVGVCMCKGGNEPPGSLKANQLVSNNNNF